MSTMTLGTARSRHLFWSHVKERFVEWRYRMRSRCELRGLDESTLSDLGVSRASADYEASKPFWMA
jgi:uncharacterized protein YjiS (DUF1127 family)